MDYFTQVALLNSLKLKHVQTNDYKAVQSNLLESQVYALLFKTEYSEGVKSRLKEKLRLELDHYIELEKQEAQKSNLDTENISKMLLEIQSKLTPLSNQVQEIHAVTTVEPEKKSTKALLEEIFIPIKTTKKPSKAEMKKAQVDALRAERLIEMKRKTAK